MEVVDLALLELGKDKEGDDDELVGAELLRAILDDTLAAEEVAAIELLKDEEATMGGFREDKLVGLLEMMSEIDVLTLLILLNNLLSRRSSLLTCLRPKSWSRKRYSGT